MSEIEYKHRNLKDAIFNLSCLAYIGVNDKTLIENLNADCERELALYEDLKKRYSKLYQASEIIKHFIKSLGLTFVFSNDKTIVIVGGDDFEYWYKCETQEEYELLREVLL